MLARLKTFTTIGLQAHLVDVEVDTVRNANEPSVHPTITTVGLPEKAVRAKQPPASTLPRDLQRQANGSF